MSSRTILFSCVLAIAAAVSLDGQGRIGDVALALGSSKEHVRAALRDLYEIDSLPYDSMKASDTLGITRHWPQTWMVSRRGGTGPPIGGVRFVDGHLAEVWQHFEPEDGSRSALVRAVIDALLKIDTATAKGCTLTRETIDNHSSPHHIFSREVDITCGGHRIELYHMHYEGGTAEYDDDLVMTERWYMAPMRPPTSR